MRARHRVSKLLLRHGIVYSDGVAWTQLHQVWLRRQHFDSLGVRTAYGEARARYRPPASTPRAGPCGPGAGSRNGGDDELRRSGVRRSRWGAGESWVERRPSAEES